MTESVQLVVAVTPKGDFRVLVGDGLVGVTNDRGHLSTLLHEGIVRVFDLATNLQDIYLDGPCE